MAEILLVALNARWLHASFGLRCLRANLGELRPRSAIAEFEIQQRPVDVAEAILAAAPRVVGIGVYVWNARQVAELVAVLKRVRPGLCIVLGGPEISFETDLQPMAAQCDHVVRGEADLAFADLCRRLLAGEPDLPKVIDAPLPHFDQLALPYDEYDDRDLAERLVYVEASRGCPFTCEFCLSSLDVPVRQAPLEPFLAAMQRLLDRGLQHFKFVDRTFNLNVKVAAAILQFFRARWRDGLFLHFELIPDRLPDALRDVIAGFPPGTLQFEVGVQSLDAATSERISRRQDIGRLADNLRWLRDHGVHLHADLIVGLPGEDLATFARGFDQLHALRPHEIQVGILKRLRGTPIVRHDAGWGMVWADEPPYEVLQTSVLPFADLQRMKRFARYWDLVANSGRFGHSAALLLGGGSPFAAFLAFSDWLYARTGATHAIALARLAALLFEHLRAAHGDRAGEQMALDWRRGGRHDWPEFLRPWLQPGDADRRALTARTAHTGRQARHRGA